MAEVIREVFSDGPEPVIALGHRLSGRLNFPRRIATAYWNAAVWTLHNRFADAVEASLKDMGIDAPAYLLKADGGAIPLSVSRERPVEALLSGPAASVMGMMALMPSCSEDTLVLDMGGTTTDIALLAAGQPVLSPDDLVVNGRSTLVRALKSVSIGLGGDSQVTVAPGIQVGPLRKGPALAFGHISRLPQCAWTCGRRGCSCVTRGCGIPCRSPRAERRVPLAGGFGLRPFPRRLRRAVVAR